MPKYVTYGTGATIPVVKSKKTPNASWKSMMTVPPFTAEHAPKNRPIVKSKKSANVHFLREG